MQSMNKIAVIGLESSVLVFKFFNIDVFPVKNASEAAGVLKENQGKYSVVFIEEFFIDELGDFLNEADLSVATTIIPLPLQGKLSGKATKRTKNFVRKAIGVSVF